MATGLLVKIGEKVCKGQRIGYMSDSGDAYGKHLHFEVWKNNNRIDPTKYLIDELLVCVPSLTRHAFRDCFILNESINLSVNISFSSVFKTLL